jgi:hypothetical protein
MIRVLRVAPGILGLLALVAFSGAESSLNKLTGSYHLGGKDSLEDQHQSTHLYLRLEGAAAKTLFDSVKVKAEYDECAGDGSVSKHIKNLGCTRSKDGKEYDCYFGINIAKGTIEGDIPC